MVSTEQFRDAMSCFHTGVTLITTTDNNEPHEDRPDMFYITAWHNS